MSKARKVDGPEFAGVDEVRNLSYLKWMSVALLSGKNTSLQATKRQWWH